MIIQSIINYQSHIFLISKLKVSLRYLSKMQHWFFCWFVAFLPLVGKDSSTKVSCQNTYVRQKFRSLSSDNMDRCSNSGESSARRERKKRREEEKGRREKIREENCRRKRIKLREKVEKSQNTVFFPCFVAPEGQKVGLLKRRARSHLGRREMKNCTPLWREADFEVKG